MLLFCTVCNAEYVLFDSVGDSMLPLICGGDIICVDYCDFGSITVGDVVVYKYANTKKNKNSLVAHVAIKKIGKRWVVKGLGNNKEDDVLVTEENFFGIVIYFQKVIDGKTITYPLK